MVEIELKYAIPSSAAADDIWRDSELAAIEEPSSREKLEFKAVYFDTACGALSANDIAFRIRLEGARVVASLKWDGKNEGALHTRQEINVPLSDAASILAPDPAVFKESPIGRHMQQLVLGKRLESIMDVWFLRRRLRVDTGKSLIEISIDTGDIITAFGSQPICELELELFSGQQNDLLVLGAQFAGRYSLVPEAKSKYARGLLLAGKPPQSDNG